MQQEKKDQNLILILLISIIALLLLFDYLWRAQLISLDFSAFYKKHILSIFTGRFKVIRGIYVTALGLLAYLTPRSNYQSSFPKVVIISLSALFIGIFIYGYLPSLAFNLFIYPVIFFLATIAPFYIVPSSGLQTKDERGLNKIAKNKKAKIQLATEAGMLPVIDERLGIYIEGTAGSGKSVLIENILYQSIQEGKAGCLYDFEGNPLEEDGATLSRLVYKALLDAKETPVKFAFLNTSDLTKTVRCNPISTKYLKTDLDYIEAGTTLMKNLEKEWVEKTDFWANNAINVVVGTMLKFRKSYPEYCTIPHIVAFLLSDFRATLAFLAEDKVLEKWIMPVMSAYRQNASSQTAGVISSSQLPITKLYTKEIFWCLAPPPEEEFNLDITNPKHPAFLCIGNNPTQKLALSPIIALILSTCMRQMNQFKRLDSIFGIDELPTIYIPNLDTLPATARKKGVCTLLSVQSFAQLEEAYGKVNATIIRDNLSNVFLGKTNNYESAERMSKIFGEYKITEKSLTQSDSGESETISRKNEKHLQPRDISQQPKGHFTGYIADATPPFFHTQFDYFSVQKIPIPAFSSKFKLGDDQQNREAMNALAGKNFEKITGQIDALLAPFTPLEEEE